MLSSRRLGLGLIALAALAVALGGLAHTPPVRAFALRAITTYLRDLGVDVRAEAFRYNLLSLTAELTRVEVAAVATPADPVFAAQRIVIDLPWRSVFGREPVVQAIEMSGAHVAIHRRTDGSFNLPVMTGAEDAAPAFAGPFNLERLVIIDLTGMYSDEVRDVDVEVAGFGLALESPPGRLPMATGRFSADGGVRVRVGEHATAIRRLDGALAFDGATLALDDVVAEAPEGSVRAKGRLDLLTAQPAIDVALEGDVSLEDATRWVASGEVPRGRIRFSGRAFGMRGDPQIALDASGDGLAWRHVEGVSLRLSGGGGSSAVTLDSLVLRAAAGTVEGRGTARLGAHGAFDGGAATIEWRDVDPGLVMTALTGDRAPRLSTRVDGSLTAALAGRDIEALTADVRLTSRQGSTAGAPVSGRAALRVAAGVWTLTHDHRVGSIRLAGSNRGRLNAGNPGASTVSGHVSVAVDDLARAARDLGTAGMAVPADLAEGLRGRLLAEADLDGTLAGPVARVGLSVTDMTAWAAGPGAVTAQGTLAPDHGELTTFEVTLGPNRAHGSASVRWRDGVLDGNLAVDAPAIEMLAAGVPAGWRPAGGMAIAAVLGGTTGEPRVAGTLVGGPLSIAGQRVERVTSSFSASGTVLAIEDIALAQDEGRASAVVRYDLATGRYAARAALEDWPVVSAGDSESGIPVEGRFTGRFEGDGSLAAPSGHVDVAVSGLRYEAYPIGSGRLDISVGEGRGSVTGIFPDLLAGVTGSVELTAPYPFLGTLAIDRVDLSRLAGAVPGEGTAPETMAEALSGTLALSAEISGVLERPGESVADLRIELFDAAIGGMPMTLARPARFRYRREDFGADHVDLQIGGSHVTLDGRVGRQAHDGQLRASVDARLDNLLEIARLVVPDAGLGGDGSITAQFSARGPLTAPQVTARLSTEAQALTYRDLPAVRHLFVDAIYDEGLLRLSRADAAWQGTSVTANAEIPAALFADYLPSSYLQTLPAVTAPAWVTADVESAGREVLAPFLDASTLSSIEAQVSGSLDVRASSLDLAAVDGWIELDRADFLVARVPFRQLAPTRLTWSSGNLRVERFHWGGEGNQLILTGGVAFGAGPADLDLDLQGVLDLRMLSAFVPDVATDGTARVQLAARGTSAAPDVQGQIALADVDVTVREPRLAITGLAGTIRATGDRLTASALSGGANGGTVTFGGAITFPGLTLGEGAITVEARQVAMALANGAQAEIDADLTLALDASVDPILGGRVTLLRGAYRDPISLTDLALGRDSAGVDTVGLAEDTLIDRLRLDVAVATAEDLRIDNNYGRADVGANLRVLGTVAQPGLSGRATIREGGQVFLGGNTYLVEQSTIDFSNPTRIEPELNLRARTRIGNYGITFGVSGTLDRLEHDLQSDPPLPESDIVSVLVTGRTLSEAGSAQTEVARDQVLGYLSGDLLGFAGRAVGLDAVRIERGVSADTLPTDLALFAGDEDPASRLTLSKYLRRDVEIVLSQNLRESGGLTWIAMYRPFTPVELRTISRDDDTRAYEFRHTLQFGGGVRSGGPGATAPSRRPPRVAAVRFAGDTGPDSDRLQSTIDLRPGDRFDFFTWQRDRDALRAFLHERGYLEARVGASRESAGPAGDREDDLLLTYTIERGPATAIRVEGLALPARLLDRLRDAWSRAVFDGFLLDDVRETVRRHLVEEGYFQAVIEAGIVMPDATTKQLVVSIVPGTRVTGRTLDFAGNRAMPTDRLLTALGPVDVRQVAWVDPDAVAAALERFYRSEGFLAAVVTIGAPEIEGVRARLGVTIEEGPRFVLARLVVTGAETLGEETVRTIADLAEGESYSATGADDARRRVERDYRRRGFNGVQATATAAVDAPAAGVTLTLAIAEGPQQVLTEVAITGAETTRPGVVADNLALETGGAVDLAAWYEARRRLYDMNVFRSVELDVEVIDGPVASGDAQAIRARVTLEEWPRYRVRYGFQLNDEPGPLAERGRELGPGLVADIQDRNLLGRAATTGLAVRLQDDFRIARAFFSAPAFVGLPIRSSVFLTRSRQHVDEEGPFPYIEDTTGLSLEQRFRLRSVVDLAYSYRLEQKRLFDPDPDPFDFFPLDERIRIGRLAGALVAERRDDPFDATRGWFHASTIEYGPEFLGSELRFVKYLGQAYYFRSLGAADRPTVLASAVRFGAGRGFGQDLIGSEKFRLGGANSVRGYPEDSLGDLDFQGHSLGGNGLLLLNQEVRFPVFRWIQGVAFLDAGNVFRGLGSVSLTGLDVGMGLGLRIRTPFALLRLDHGTAVSPRPGERANRWYLSIGQAF